MTEPDRLWESLNRAHPNAGRLALLTCLPLRVAPEFVRLARLRLVEDGGDTGDEADLWLSDLVETRSAAGFSYRRPVRGYLRDQLRANPALLDDLWYRVHVERAPWIAARARLEEELTWRLLRDRSDPVIEERWAEIVAELDELDNPEGTARWIVRAVSDLPEGTHDHPSGRRAFLGASLLLGDASVLGTEPLRFLDSGALAFATRRLPRRPVFVGLSPQGVIVSPSAAIANGHEIAIPATTPLWLQLESRLSTPFSQAPQVVTLDADTPREVSWLHSNLALRTIDGALFALEPEQVADTRQAARVRVEIEYDVEFDGAEKKVQLPLVIGVFADLSGDRLEPLSPVSDRKLVQIDRDNFDDVLKRTQPRLSFRVPNLLGGSGSELQTELRFERLDDFRPWNVARQIGPTRQRLEARKRLNDFQTHVIGDSTLQSVLDEAFREQGNWASWADLDGDAFSKTELGGRILALRPPEDEFWRRSLMAGVPELARQVHESSSYEFDGVWEASSRALTELDAALARQLDVIVHHETFQQLESAWLGLNYFVTNTDTDQMLKIRVLNISKKELGMALAGAPYETVIFKKVYEDEYGTFGGEPYGLIVGDYYFDNSADDVATLDAMAEVCAAAHAPFVAALSPRFAGLERWGESFDSAGVGRALSREDYAAWRSFREADRARYVGLTLPRFLARRPYGSQHDFDAEFTFNESTGADAADYVWGNAAYVMATNIAAAFARYRWCARIAGVERGGARELPVHLFPTTDGEVQARSTETVLTDRDEFALSRQGLMPLISLKGTASSTFFSAPSLHGAPDDTAPRANAANDDWRRLLPCCRFLHYIKCIVRDRMGSFRTAEEVQGYLQRWIEGYVDGNAMHRTDELKARRPLAFAELSVEGGPDSPTWVIRLRIMPHYQDSGSFVETVPPEFVTLIPGLSYPTA